MSDKTLIYYSNHNLQTPEWDVEIDGTRNASPSEIQAIPIARGNGSSVVNTKIGAKMISVSGHKVTGDQSANIEELLENYDKIFNVDPSGNHYLRKIPDYEEIITTSVTTGWTAGSDTTNLATQTDEYQYDGTSLGFDIDVSNSGNDYAELTYTGTAWDGSSKTKADSNFEFWLNIPDVYYVTSIDFRIGNDASNYYSATLQTDYQGNNLNYGVNLFSALWDSMDTTGTPTDSALDYVYIKINYSSEAEDITGCYLDGIQWVNEARVRNFPALRSGEISRSGRSYEVDYVERFGMQFLNHTGYAISTHSYELFEETGITVASDTQAFSISGSMPALIQYDIDVNDATNLDSFEISNLVNNSSATFDPDGVVDADSFVIGGLDKRFLKNGSDINYSGRIPAWQLGINRAVISLIPQTGEESISYSSNMDGTYDGSGLYDLAAVSFTPSISGSVRYVYLSGLGQTGMTDFNSVYLAPDSSGAPGTRVYQGQMQISKGSVLPLEHSLSGLSYSVTSGSTYWFIMDVSYTANLAWESDSSKGNVNSVAKRGIGGTTDAWDSTPLDDLYFGVVIEPTPSWDVDWTGSYQKLYLS